MGRRGSTARRWRCSTRRPARSSPRCRAARRRTSSGPSTPRGKAWDEWQTKTPKDRMELLLALADVMEENAEELWQLESQNVGKPAAIAVDEIPFSVDNLRFFAGAARNLEGKSAAEYVEGYTSIIRREPLGIVAGITPWNYPLMMVVWKLGPALAAGNVQILKPAEQTPLTTLRFFELAQDVRAAGRRPGDHRRRRPRGRHARPAPGSPARVPDRRRRDREDDRPQRGGHAQARAPRAGRQGADGRARRRRPRDRRRGDQDRRLLELRPGLHRLLADHRARGRVRRRARRVGEGRSRR